MYFSSEDNTLEIDGAWLGEEDHKAKFNSNTTIFSHDNGDSGSR